MWIHWVVPAGMFFAGWLMSFGFFRWRARKNDRTENN